MERKFRWMSSDSLRIVGIMARRRELMISCNCNFRPRLVRGLGAGLALAALSLAWLRHPLSRGSAAPAHETRLREVLVNSAHLPHSLSSWVCLPLGYDNPANRRRRYPVVYLLHGSPGKPRDWIDEGEIADIQDSLIAAGQIQPMILVAADGRGPAGEEQCTGWLDSAGGELPMERVFVKEFVPKIDRLFRTVAAANGRALLGVSAGGYAAYNLGTRHPADFGVLAAHSGYFLAEEDDEVVLPMLGAESLRVRDNSPFDRMATQAARWTGRLFFDCGADDDLAPESVRLHQLLQHEGVAHHYALVPGDHSWETWRARFPISLRYIQSAFQRLAPALARRPPAHS
jgi:enterochelin esterase-like enzyme